MTLNHFYAGRIARLNYFLAALTMGVCAWVLALLFALLLGKIGGLVVLILIYIVVIFIDFSLIVRRCHDIGWRGWWSLLLLIPLVNIVFSFIILFKKGEEAANIYGSVPPTAVDIMATLFPKTLSTDSVVTMPPSTPPDASNV